MVFLFHVLGVYLLWITARALNFQPLTVGIGLALYGLSLPVVVYAQYAYTDLLTGYVTFGTGALLWLHARSQKSRYLWLASTLAGLGVFLHVKLLIFPLLAFPLYAGYLVWRQEKKTWSERLGQFFRTYRLAALATALSLTVLVILFCYQQYLWTGYFRPDGVFVLLEQQGNLDFDGFFQASPVYILQSLLGLFWDGENGLLFNAPLFLLTFPGLVVFTKRYPRAGVLTATVIFLLLLRQASYREWRTWGPPARYLTTFVPGFFIFSLYALALLLRKWWGKLAVLFFGGYTFALSLTLFVAGKFGYPEYRGESAYFSQLLSWVNLSGFGDFLTLTLYPSYDSVFEYWGAGLLTGIWLVMCGYFYFYTPPEALQ